jgi:hypothetical protein
MSLIHKAGKIRPEPSPYRQQIKDLDVIVGAVAQYIGRTYVHTLNMLNGVESLPPATESKIQQLIEDVQSGKI